MRRDAAHLARGCALRACARALLLLLCVVAGAAAVAAQPPGACSAVHGAGSSLLRGCVSARACE
jgi:hypothetical protein